MAYYSFSIKPRYEKNETVVLVSFSLKRSIDLPLEAIRDAVERWMSDTSVGKYLYRKSGGIVTWVSLAEYDGISSFIAYAAQRNIHDLEIRTAINPLGDYTERVFSPKAS